MKMPMLAMPFLFAAMPILSFAAGVSFDAKGHSVTLTAVSTDCGVDTQLEFLLVGPDSDHDYEAMFVTEASVKEIADAFAKAGIPNGVPIDLGACRFWPVGNALEMKPSFGELVREMRGDATPPVVFTGGLRDAAGVPDAHTNMPCAVFALYNCAQSMLMLDDSLDQSTTYGRFRAAVKIPKGEKREFTFTWKGATDVEHVVAKAESGKLPELISMLKDKSAGKELDVTTDFSPALTLREANLYAQTFSMIDSAKIKLNGFAKGQLYYRAYLPLEKWRDRKERLAQPPEVHLKADGTAVVCEILEDWSGDDDSLEPKLSEKAHSCADLNTAATLAEKLGARTQTVLVYTSPETRLERIYSLKKGMKAPMLNWYVFTE